MRQFLPALTLLTLAVCLSTPVWASDQHTIPENTWKVTVEGLTDFPLQVGGGVQVQGPLGLSVHSTIGVMPRPYLDTINAIAVDAGWYNQLTADLIGATLENSLLWRIGMRWRPLNTPGFYIGGGYGLATLGGGLNGAEVIAAAANTEVPASIDGTRNFKTSAQLHLIDLELGWEFVFLNHFFLRTAIGGTFTVGATTIIDPDWNVSRLAKSAVETLSTAGAKYLDDTMESYVHTFTLSLACGWQF